ncbi:Ger(x)C family spore germination protein [Bacillota bacterium LX-D]|nr:Ger(x)C family spore germination protein [Bacillota bacterium LX-D]
MRKIALLLCLCLLLTILPSGCYDQREVNEMAYVIAMGLDVGVKNKLRLTLQIANMGQAPNGGMEQGSSQVGPANTTIITVDCPSVFTGLNLANVASSRQINLMHSKLIVFSEKLARSGDINKYAGAMLRYLEMRRIMNVVVSKGDAETFLKENNFFIGQDPVKDIFLMIKQGAYSGFYPQVTLNDFYNDLKSTLEEPYATLAGVNNLKELDTKEMKNMQSEIHEGDYIAGKTPRRSGKKSEYFGMAVFRSGTMVGELTGEEARIFQFLNGKFEYGFYTINDPQKPNNIIALALQTGRTPKVSVDLRGEVPKIKVEVDLEGSIASIQSRINYENPKLKKQLEKAFEQEVKRKMNQLLYKCQHEYRSDIFGFARAAVWQFATIPDWQNYNWSARFPDAEITASVNFHIRRTGMILKSAPLN